MKHILNVMNDNARQYIEATIRFLTRLAAEKHTKVSVVHFDKDRSMLNIVVEYMDDEYFTKSVSANSEEEIAKKVKEFRKSVIKHIIARD